MEEYMEKTEVQEMPKEETDEELEKVIKEFEADVWFRTRMPVPTGDYQDRIPSFAQAKTAYETVAGFDKAADNKTVLAHKKA